MGAADAGTHRKRRERLAALVGDGTAFAANPPLPADHAASHRPDPDMFYLTGMTEPDCSLALAVEGGRIAGETVHCRARDPEYERWNGELLGPLRASRLLEVDDVRTWKGSAAALKEAVGNGAERLHVRMDSPAAAQGMGLLSERKAAAKGSVHDLRWATARLRMVKDRTEAALIESCCRIAVEALDELAAALPGAAAEADLEASLAGSYARRGAEHAFRPIVACGRNACVAHYTANSARLARGKLVLVDTGARRSGYTSDITRVYPLSGRFTEAQRELYGTVLSAQKAAIRRIKPGSTLESAQRSASRELAKGLASMGVCRGKPERVMASGAFADFYFHSIGHMLGIEVHDPIVRKDEKGRPLKLAPGMAVTVEPGLYLDGRKQVPRELRNTGVRIEDLVLVTRTGNRVLTAAAPKDPSEVEGLLG